MTHEYRNLEDVFLHLHNNPPPPFNPAYDPNSKARREMISGWMEADGFYNDHSREQCADEYRRRYRILLEEEKSVGK
jgi:hypothetical protein